MGRKIFLFFIPLFLFAFCNENFYYKNFKPPKVLFIAESNHLASFAYYIERITGCDLTYTQIFYNDQDYHHLCDKPLEETKNDIEYVNNKGEKFLLNLLENIDDFDIIFASFSPDSKDEKVKEKLFNIEKKLSKVVKNGKSLVFINPRWEITFENTPLYEIMPVKFDGKRKSWTFCPGKASNHPLTIGLPFEITGTYWYGPVYIPIDEKSIPLTIRENYPNFWYREVDKGKVVFLYAFPADRVDWIGTDYKAYAGDRPDESEVWISFFNRLVWYLKYGEKAFPVFLNLNIDENMKIKYGQKIELPVKVINISEKEENIELIVQISTRYTDKNITEKKKIILKSNEEKTEIFNFSVDLPKIDKYLYIKSLALNEKGEIINESYKWIFYESEVLVNLKTDKDGYRVGEDIKVNLEISELKNDKNYEIFVYLIDREGRILEKKNENIKAESENKVLNFNFKMPQESPDYLSSYWLKSLILSENRICASSDFVQVQNDEIWDMRKQFQFSLWTSGGSYPKMKLLFDSGFNSLGYPGNSYICDRYGLRQYVESTGINTFGVEIKYPDWDGVRKEMEKVIENLNKKGSDSRSKCLVSLQEEGGFGGGWGTRYYWKEDKAPEIPQKVFNEYLREIYKNDIKKLNEEWNANYNSFEEIPLEKNKSVYPSSIFVTSQAWEALSQEQKKIKIPVDFKEPDINKKYLAYTSPYYQTYRFFDWYYQKYCDLATEIYKKNRNPVPLTICSAPGGFYPKVDVYNFAGLGPFYPKETGLVENAIARRDYGDIPGFSGAMWAYFDLFTLWNCTVISSIIAGNTHIDYWVDTPLTFNPDLTHTRASFWTKELRKKIKHIEPILLHKRFSYTKGLGIFIPEQPLPKGIFGRHFGSSISCNGPVYSALEESGYMPKIVKPEEFKDLSILILSYSQVINKEEGEKIKDFVKNGGILISTPWSGAVSPYGNFYTVYPSEESGLVELLGFKLLNTSQELKIEEFVIESNNYPEIKGLSLKSKGRDKILELNEDVKIIAKYKDGTPAILERKYGKGKVIYLNFIYDWDNWWNSFYEKSREAYRRLFDTLIKKNSNVKNEYFISFLSYEKTELNKGWWGMYLKDIPEKGDAIPYWASQLYSDPTGEIKYLFIFSDHRSPIIEGEINLEEKNKKLINLITGQEVKKNENGNYKIVLNPGDGVFLCIINQDSVVKDIIIDLPNFIKSGEYLNLEISLVGAKNGIYTGIIEIYSSNEYLKSHSILNLQLPSGKVKTKVYFAENEYGDYKIIFKESITGISKEKIVKVLPSNQSIDKRFLSPFTERKEDKILLYNLDSSEFIELFRKIKNIYEGDYTGLENKYMLSYYLYVPFIKETRHSIIRKLQRTEWMRHFDKFKEEIRKGEVFYLIGEDINIDPISGLEIDPLASKDIKEFIEKLRKAGEVEIEIINDIKIEKIKIGKGCLIILYDTVDRSIYHSDDFKIWHQKIKSLIKKLIL
ncbi:MAG: beta-galactosidase trimerization domain-containing protein [Candidatus Ratteibacteria bacterium]